MPSPPAGHARSSLRNISEHVHTQAASAGRGAAGDNAAAATNSAEVPGAAPRGAAAGGTADHTAAESESVVIANAILSQPAFATECKFGDTLVALCALYLAKKAQLSASTHHPKEMMGEHQHTTSA